jgi:hypothetical protein
MILAFFTVILIIIYALSFAAMALTAYDDIKNELK